MSFASIASAADSNDDLAREAMHDAYERVPILPPDRAGKNLEPSDDEVWRSLREIDDDSCAVALHDRFPGAAFRIKKELIADFLDPPRVLPLVGPVQVHFLRWKCSVCIYAGTENVPGAAAQDTMSVDEVAYIDRTQLIALPNADEADSRTGVTPRGVSSERNAAAARSSVAADSASAGTRSAAERGDHRKQRQLRWRLLRRR
ncbi:MAG: hypothetical protein WD875_16185 [Pirellulales bacterium]